MRVTMFWHGGSSYAVFDVHNRAHAEVFNSLAEAKRAFMGRANGRDSYYPCVDDCAPEGAAQKHGFSLVIRTLFSGRNTRIALCHSARAVE